MTSRKNNFWRFLYKLHRYIGLLSSIVLIMLAITGIALNHTEELQLDSNMVQSSTILDWYGIKTPDTMTSFATPHHWLTQVDQQIYFDNSPLMTNEKPLLGVIESDQFIVGAFNDMLILLSLDGELIEQNSFDNIQRIGIDKQQSVIIVSNNITTSSRDGLLSWQSHDSKNIVWSVQNQLPKSIAESIKKDYRSTILPMERLLLDLHSGRFFGIIGIYIIDLSGIFLIILAFSGSAIWLKHKLRSLLHHYRQ